MKMSSKIAGYLEIVGLIVIVISSLAWVLHLEWVPIVYTLGTIVFAIGRMAVQRTIPSCNLTVNRLKRQRTFAVFVILFSAMLMSMEPGWYLGYNFYLTKSAWLVPFIVFVIIEVYTAFRLPSALKKC